MNRLPLGYSIRLAIVKNVQTTQVTCSYLDRLGEQPFDCPIPHPLAGVGAGIFAGIQRDTRVLVAQAPHEQPYIVGFVPDRKLYFDDVPGRPLSVPEYPKVLPGEICVQGPTGSYMQFFKDGSISFDAGIGDKTSDIELSTLAQALFFRTNNIYNFTEAGRNIEGVILRDTGAEENPDDTKTIDFLSGETYSTILDKIGRSPTHDPSARTVTISKSVVRNPALIEKRSITYEYANSYGVRALPFESKAMLAVNPNTVSEDIKNISSNLASRENRRTDILDLNYRNYNHLIEKVEGTVVDIYGNILDINRNVIPVPDPLQIGTDSNVSSSNGLRRLYSFLRRSIKYHMEINSRKDILSIEPSVNTPGYNAKDHSRWSIDVDGEGLTKINIPASSETGNIPVLSRYVVSRSPSEENEDSGSFKAEDKIDVKVLQFGPKGSSDDYLAGQRIEDTTYAPKHVSLDPESKTPIVVTVGTAYHDVMNIANSIFTKGKLKDPEAAGGEAKNPITDILNNIIPEMKEQVFDPSVNDKANAGGRSIHANLDGSIEMSIGADTADRKSLLLDLAGGVISHYGRDRNGRSIIHQSDGDVIIQIGGKGLDDPRFDDTTDKPGRVEIHLNRPGGESQKIIVDEKGITFDIVGNGIFKTSGDMSLTAGGRLLLDGERIWAFGSVDDDVNGTRKIKGIGGEREIIRKGRII